MTFHRLWPAALCIAALSGCADPNHVIFVTDTSLGINVDGKPPTVSLAYDRTEGYFAPAYANGALPPVVASVKVGGGFFNPKISQVYATGTAAQRTANPNCAASGSVAHVANCPDDSPATLSGAKAAAFFGTSTTVGFKVAYSTDAVPDSFTFGYKRKEFSILPLGKDASHNPAVDTYPSVLASIDSNTSVLSQTDGDFDHTQFIATGEVADTLSVNPAVSKAFAYATANAAADAVTLAQRDKVLKAADALAPGLNQAQTENIAAVSNYLGEATQFPAQRDKLLQNSGLTANDYDRQQLAKTADKTSFLNYLTGNYALTQALAAATSKS